jgi:hypothetical protein
LAIFGKLSDFSLREVTSMIGRRSGALLLEGDDGGRVHLQISGESVVQISVERSITSEDEAAQLLRRFALGEGSFRFDQRADADLQPGPLQLNWQQLLPVVAVEAKPQAVDLPHPQTCFILIKGRNVPLDSQQSAFLERGGALLERGASAEQLSHALHLPVTTVQQHLQALREVKKIWPVRAHVERTSTPEKKERSSLASRLLGLFLK